MPRGVNLYDEANLQQRLWTPAVLIPSVWLDASDLSTVTITSTGVSEWRHKTGNGVAVTNATTTKQPAYVASALNELGGIDFYADKALRYSASVTVRFACVVTKSRLSTWYSFHAHLDNTNGSSRIGGLRSAGNTGFHTDTSPGAVWEDGISKTVSTSGFSTITNPHIIGWNVPGARGNPASGVTIGNYDTGNNGGSGVEFETIALPYVPSTAQRQAIEGYLAWKWWGAANTLSADHPFLNRPPMIGD